MVTTDGSPRQNPWWNKPAGASVCLNRKEKEMLKEIAEILTVFAAIACFAGAVWMDDATLALVGIG